MNWKDAIAGLEKESHELQGRLQRVEDAISALRNLNGAAEPEESPELPLSPEEKLMTIAQIAKLKKLSPSCISSYIRNGKIPYTSAGKSHLLRLHDIEDYIKELQEIRPRPGAIGKGHPVRHRKPKVQRSPKTPAPGKHRNHNLKLWLKETGNHRILFHQEALKSYGEFAAQVIRQKNSPQTSRELFTALQAAVGEKLPNWVFLSLCSTLADASTQKTWGLVRTVVKSPGGKGKALYDLTPGARQPKLDKPDVEIRGIG